MSPRPSNVKASEFYRPTWAEVSKSAFSSNLTAVRQWVGPKVQVLAVLKADAYGLGALPLARLAAEQDIWGIGVSSLEEGIELREGGIRSRILLLAGVYPLENFEVALDHDLIPTVASFEAAQALRSLAIKIRRPVKFHLKVDTGMGRIGVSPASAQKILAFIAESPELKLEGIATHLASAESDENYTSDQLGRFETVRAQAKALGFDNVLAHAANSAALIAHPSSRLDLVRPGLSLYGVSPVAGPGPALTPVFSWMTKIVFLKRVPAGTYISYGRTYRTNAESDIATLPAGYADGVPRRSSGRAQVIVKGKRCPVLGRVTMDHIMVDVTGLGANVGDAVTLIGRQDKEEIRVDEWATWADTVSYEILCGVTKRVPRVITA